MGKILVLSNQKGGVSKSTLSALMAYGMYHRGLKVLLVDMDPQRNLSKWMKTNIPGAPTTMELLLGSAKAEEAIQKLDCFDMIPSRRELVSVDGLLPVSGRLKRLKRALAPVKDLYDWIIIDTPPSLGTLSVNALVAADEVLVPSTASVFSIEGFLDLHQTITEIQEDDNPDLVLRGVVITMFHNRTNIVRDLSAAIKELGEKFNVKTFNSKIRSSVFIMESQAHRFDPFVEGPKNIVMLDTNAFLDEFLDEGGKDNE